MTSPSPQRPPEACPVEPDDDYDTDYADDEEEFDEFEEAAAECGLLPPHLGGGCMNAGTEHCDFDCPFRDNPGLLTGDDDDDE